MKSDREIQTEPLNDGERAVMEALRMDDTRAPDALHSAVARMMPRRPRPQRRMLALGGGLAVTACFVLLAIVLTSGGGAPSADRAVAMAMAPASEPAPKQSASSRDELNASIQGVAFPDWEYDQGWSATGVRTTSLAGRDVKTVVYRDSSGGRVGYAIVGGSALPVPAGRTVTIGGADYTVLRRGGATAVVWERSGHTCVVASRTVPAASLLRLASSEA